MRGHGEKMKCSNCGKEVAEGKKFCGSCGTKIIADKEVAYEEKQKAESQELNGKSVVLSAKPINSEIPKWFLIEVGILGFIAVFLLVFRMISFIPIYLLMAAIAILPTIFAVQKHQRAGLRTDFSSFMWPLISGIIINVILFLIIGFLARNAYLSAISTLFFFVPAGIGVINSIFAARHKSSLIHALISGFPMLLLVILNFLDILALFPSV
jgi:hypothetical protein